jgi:hypothetical protein
MTSNKEPIFIASPIHNTLTLTTEVTATRDPGSATLPTLAEGGDNGAIVTSLSVLPISTGGLGVSLRLYLLKPGEAKGTIVLELAVSTGATATAATLPTIDASRTGIFVPPDATLQAALSTEISGGVTVSAQGGTY